MKLDCFDTVYTAVQELFLKGESLVCEGEAITVAVRPVETAQRQIEVLYLAGGNVDHTVQRFNAHNYQSSGLDRLQVANGYRALLAEGENNGTQPLSD